MELPLLVGHDVNTIIYHMERLLTDKKSYLCMAEAGSPYGDGYAARRIANIITKFLFQDRINLINYEVNHSNSLL